MASLGVALFGLHKCIPTEAQLSKMAVIDGVVLKREGKPFQDVENIIQRETESIEKNLSQKFAKKKEHLKQTMKLLNDKTLPAQKRAEYKASYKQEAANVERELQQQTDELRRRIDVIEQTINDTMFDISKQLAKKYKLSVILNTSVANIATVFYADRSLDLTKEAVEMLNQQLKNLDSLFAGTANARGH
jgi:Skp family chaperone for outer membrane proteins